MDRLPYRTPPRWWSPLLRPRFIRFFRPFRRHIARRNRLRQVEVRGLEILQAELNRGHGVMIVSKHVGHVDHHVLLSAAEALRIPFYFMAGWQVFELLGPVERLVVRLHGSFSVDREGNDLRAFRQAVEVLQHSRHPLVMFPEGEIYHHNDVVFPFRPGTAAIAQSAARRSSRPIICVPAGIRYFHAEDHMPQLLNLMSALEGHLGWQARPEAPLGERVVRFADAWIILRELEYLGEPQRGALPQRINSLAEVVLGRVEERQDVQPPPAAGILERITPLRQHAIRQRESVPSDDAAAREADRDLEDVLVVTQLFSYSRDYDTERVSTERLAEILDKFEEDVLARPTATPRADRRAIIAFGPPIEVKVTKRSKEDVPRLTQALERGVHLALGQIPPSPSLHDLPLTLARRG